MHFITSKCYIQLPITSRIRSIVHCHRGCEFEPRRRTFLWILYLHQFIYLEVLFIIIISKPFGLINIALMIASNAYPIELMHSVASHICVFVFDNALCIMYFLQPATLPTELYKLISNSFQNYT